MENLKHKQSKIYKGTGWLLGILLSIVSALVVFSLSGSFIAAISAAIPVGIFAGMSIELKFQEQTKQTDMYKTKIRIISILVGFACFVTVYSILFL